MALQRQITLRNVKGSALTYAEMDQNLSSFFYSASLSGTDLLLHYTGSAVLNPPYTPSAISVPLNPLLTTITQLSVAGLNEGDIQYRIDPSTLGADTSFKWDTGKLRLGVGTPSPLATVDIKGTNEATIVKLTSETTTNKQAYIDFFSGTLLLGSFGKTRGGSSNIFTDLQAGRSLLTAVAGTTITQTNSTGLGIFTGTSGPNRALTVVGVIGVGSTIATQGQIGSIGNKVPVASLPGTGTTGLLIESPFSTAGSTTGGHVVIGINKTGTTAFDDCFSVIAATTGQPGTYNIPILTAKADNKVGINKQNPSEALDIVGNTTMTGNINAAGNATIAGTATIGTVTDSLGANSQILTRNSTTGLIQYTTNVMPLGGIIMWSGSPTALPTGWALCDGTGEWSPGNPIPDLRERFIVGAGGNNTGVVTYNFNSFFVENTALVFKTTTATNGFAPRTLTNRTFTKVNETSGVDSSGALINPFTVSGTANNPQLNRQYAIYESVGGTSYFIVYNNQIGAYRMYQGTIPAFGTNLDGNASGQLAYPRYDLTPGDIAELRINPQVGSPNIMVFRPNAQFLRWQENTTGYAVNDVGGFNHAGLEISQMPTHKHPVLGFLDGSSPGEGLTLTNTPNGDEGTFGTNLSLDTGFVGANFPHENRPPYYALAFIIYKGV